jgi:hypothetical protein
LGNSPSRADPVLSSPSGHYNSTPGVYGDGYNPWSSADWWCGGDYDLYLSRPELYGLLASPAIFGIEQARQMNAEHLSGLNNLIRMTEGMDLFGVGELKINSALLYEFGSGGIAKSNQKAPDDFYAWFSITWCLQYLRNTSEEFRSFEMNVGTIGVSVSHRWGTQYDPYTNSIIINPISFTHVYFDSRGGDAKFDAEFITNHEYQEAVFIWKYINDGFVSNHCDVIQAANDMTRLGNSPDQGCADRNRTLNSRIGGDYRSREKALQDAEAALIGIFY